MERNCSNGETMAFIERKHIRSSVALRLCFTLLGVAMPSAADAQAWPTKQVIRAVVPLTAGSATDVLARVVFDQVSRQVGQTIIVENRPGAAQTIGTAAVAKSEPDGYTILVNSSSHTVFPSTFSHLPFDVIADFSAVAPLASIPTVMVVAPAKGYKTLSDFIALAKAKPGSMTYGSGGVGNSTHLAAERLRLATGFDGLHVPFKGAPEALTEVMAGRVDFYFSPLPPALPLIRDGKLQALAVSSLHRASALPEVPTTNELGLQNSHYEFWVGVFAPSATPRPIIERLYREIVLALELPNVREKLKAMGADPMPMTPREFDEYVKKEVEMNAAVVKAAGIRPN
jgi:tripartite-type tricarboxylate transporter receptor subunit TctC